jgi:hypothetical protein
MEKRLSEEEMRKKITSRIIEIHNKIEVHDAFIDSKQEEMRSLGKRYSNKVTIDTIRNDIEKEIRGLYKKRDQLILAKGLLRRRLARGPLAKQVAKKKSFFRRR